MGHDHPQTGPGQQQRDHVVVALDVVRETVQQHESPSAAPDS